MPSDITQEVLDELKSFQLYPDDVFVVTYPKCGTTWAQQIVKLIRKNKIQDDVHINMSLHSPQSQGRGSFILLQQ